MVGQGRAVGPRSALRCALVPLACAVVSLSVPTAEARSAPSLGGEQASSRVVEVVLYAKPTKDVGPRVLGELLQLARDRLGALGVKATVRQANGALEVVWPGPHTSGAVEALGQELTAPGYVLFRSQLCPVGAPQRAASKTLPTTAQAQAVCKLSTHRQALYASTPLRRDEPSSYVLLPGPVGRGSQRLLLGPAEMSGTVVKSARAVVQKETDEWVVDMSFTAKGSTLFNQYASSHYQC